MAVLILYIAIFTVLGCEFAMIAEIQQRAHIRISQQHNIAAFASIASVGPTVGNILFPVKTDTAVASITGFHFDLRNINKHNRSISGPRALFPYRFPCRLW